MAFTYEMDLSQNQDRVRFEIGDTDPDAFFLHDAEIQGLLTLNDDDWQLAALAGIRAIIARLSRPDFRADWLQVSNKEAIASYRRLLSEKQDEYAVNLQGSYWFESTGVDVVRDDFNFDEEESS